MRTGGAAAPASRGKGPAAEQGQDPPRFCSVQRPPSAGWKPAGLTFLCVSPSPLLPSPQPVSLYYLTCGVVPCWADARELADRCFHCVQLPSSGRGVRATSSPSNLRKESVEPGVGVDEEATGQEMWPELQREPPLLGAEN
eukprot:1746921-Rhodomonas_salina.1